MRRDYFTLTIRRPDGEGSAGAPTLLVDFDGPVPDLEERLEGRDGPLDAGSLDVNFRLVSSIDADDAAGVLSVTNRITGEFVLELNAKADEVLSFVDAARTLDDADDGHYRLVIRADGETLGTYEKSTFLVYDVDSGLIRQHSLIPSGVEL
ncbi:MAG: DUF5793 family protein [Haloarculaceae archaeon]